MSRRSTSEDGGSQQAETTIRNRTPTPTSAETPEHRGTARHFIKSMSSGEGEREELGRRSFWVQPWIGGRRQLFVELCNGASFKNFMRIPPEMFDELGPRITMQPWLWDQVSLNAIWMEGASQHHSLLNPEVCYNAIIDEYKDGVMKSPSTRDNGVSYLTCSWGDGTSLVGLPVVHLIIMAGMAVV